VKVLDFGIAKAEERATKTVGGTIKGKYGYMSPEQCKGKPIDRRSDIFALGICLYELTTLRRAFKGADDFETMKRIVSGELVLPSAVVPGYPRELEAIILTAMANDPNARFQTAQEMIEALDAFAARAKLTASNSALKRFMTSLFGPRKEPWADVGNTERTQVAAEVVRDDGDNVKTVVIRPPDRGNEGSSDEAEQEAMLFHDPAAWQQQEPRPRMRTRPPVPGVDAASDPRAPMPLRAPTTHPGIGDAPQPGPGSLSRLESKPARSMPVAPAIAASGAGGAQASRSFSTAGASSLRRSVLIFFALVALGIAAGVGAAKYHEFGGTVLTP